MVISVPSVVLIEKEEPSFVPGVPFELSINWLSAAVPFHPAPA